MVRPHSRTALAVHIARTYKATHPHAPRGGSSSLLPIDYELAYGDSLIELLDLIGPLPEEVTSAMVTEAPASTGSRRRDRIERKELRAYHTRCAELIMQLVNMGWCTFRFQKNAIVLYAIDGSSPYTVNARKDDREWKMLQKWAGRHITGEDNPLGLSTKQMIEKLARAMNDPAEHPAPAEPKPSPTPRTAPIRKAHSTPTVEAPRPAEPEPEPEPVWKTYVSGRGESLPNWETNGEVIRCRACWNDNPRTDWHTTEPASLGGHWRTVHDRETLDSEETIAKRNDSRRYNKLVGTIEDSVKSLAAAAGLTIGGTDEAYVEELENSNDELTHELVDVRRQLAKVTEDYEQLRAWVDLLPTRPS